MSVERLLLAALALGVATLLVLHAYTALTQDGPPGRKLSRVCRPERAAWVLECRKGPSHGDCDALSAELFCHYKAAPP